MRMAVHVQGPHEFLLSYLLFVFKTVVLHPTTIGGANEQNHLSNSQVLL